MNRKPQTPHQWRQFRAEERRQPTFSDRVEMLGTLTDMYGPDPERMPDPALRAQYLLDRSIVQAADRKENRP